MLKVLVYFKVRASVTPVVLRREPCLGRQSIFNHLVDDTA